MAFDEKLDRRISNLLLTRDGVDAKKMFGGICYLVRGNMACGIIGDELIVRGGPANQDRFLALPHTRIFDITGRPMKGWIVVSPAGIAADDDLARWVGRGVDFALSLPPKG